MKISEKGSSFSLNKVQDQVKDIFTKISSGQRINKASDDAAGLAISMSLEASISTTKQAQRNIGDAVSLTNIADGAASQISGLQTRQQELAAQSSNGTYSDEQRQQLNQEYQALSAEIDRIAQTTEFNGVKPLSGSSTSIQAGTSSDPNSQIQVSGVSISSGSGDISTQAGAQAALDSVAEENQELNSKRADLGASQSRLSVAESANSSRIEGETEAQSRIRDVDLAEETARLTATQIKLQANTAFRAQANLDGATVAKLLTA